MSRSQVHVQARVRPRAQAAYAPSLRRYGEPDEAPVRRSPLIFAGLVVVAAFGGLVWNQYAGATIPRIEAPPGPYKIPPPPGQELAADALERNALYDALEGRAAAVPASARPAPEEPLSTPSLNAGSASLASPPSFAADGPYVAQVAALQSQAAIGPAWQRLAEQAPELFEGARRDVQLADLGARGIYFRLRVGYFPDRINAARFCERVKALGQDCVAAAR
jgi:hypothetical protein